MAARNAVVGLIEVADGRSRSALLYGYNSGLERVNISFWPSLYNSVWFLCPSSFGSAWSWVEILCYIIKLNGLGGELGLIEPKFDPS
jgi:hypothetical protein